MNNDLTRLFKESAEVQAPTDLTSRICARIDAETKLEDKRDRYFWGTFFILSLFAFVSSAAYAYQEFKASNFGSYVSLVFSDSSIAVKLWREIGLSLVESLPFISIVAILGSVAVLLWSARKFTKEKSPLLSGEISRA